MTAPADSRPVDLISAFGVLLKNRVRPTGLARLGLPCFLTGSGMAFPWDLLARAPLGSGHLVEDMQLSIDMAVARAEPRFCSAARVWAPLPAAPSAAWSQRTRWEHGHLLTMLAGVPRLVAAAVRQGRVAPAAMALDLCIPPLALLAWLWLAAACAGLLAGVQTGRWLPLALAGAAAAMLATAVAAAWGRFGRRLLPARAILAAPWYILRKLPLYAGFLVRRQRTWVRTQRDVQRG